MWFAKGSRRRADLSALPGGGYGFGDTLVGDITHVNGVSDPDDSQNTLARVADRYDQVLVAAKAGDVVFFNGHVLHRSKQNFTTDRFRRAFVGHYCNARSFTQWGARWPARRRSRVAGDRPGHEMTNGSHILARGDTHLPFAQPTLRHPLRRDDVARTAPTRIRLRRPHHRQHEPRPDGLRDRRARCEA